MEEGRREMKPPPQQPTEIQRHNLPPPPPQKCLRCDSLDTKFCYYNNYSLSQPRYYCKACRRYWTHGGTLRDVPIGGASRKKKRVKTSFTQLQPVTSLDVGTNYYAGGGFMSSLSAMNSFPQPPPPSLQVGSSYTSSSLYPGFTLSPPISQQQYQFHQQTGFYETANQGLSEPDRVVHFLNQSLMNPSDNNSGSNPTPSVGTSFNPSFFPDFSGYGPPSS